MLRLTVAVFAVALASSAIAADWRDLRVDASSEAAYQRTLATFNKDLPPERRSVFTAGLMDIWLKGTATAGTSQSQYTVSDYYREIHGLSYEQVVTFTDPTGKTAKEREREAKRTLVADTSGPAQPAPGNGTQMQRMERAHESLDHGELMRTRQGGSTTRARMPCGQVPAERAEECRY
jgi:hypothetical protein